MHPVLHSSSPASRLRSVQVYEYGFSDAGEFLIQLKATRPQDYQSWLRGVRGREHDPSFRRIDQACYYLHAAWQKSPKNKPKRKRTRRAAWSPRDAAGERRVTFGIARPMFGAGTRE